MMALVTHQLQVQGSYIASPSRPLSCSKGIRMKRFVWMHHMKGRTDGLITLKCHNSLNVSTPIILRPKAKSFKILAFKGIGQNEESASRASESKSLKGSIKLSYVPQESEETIPESPKVQNLPVTCSFETDDATAGPLSIHSLFKSWLALLRTAAPNPVLNETLEGSSLIMKSKEVQNAMHKKGKNKILKAAWCLFLGLDSSVKIPLLIFVPWYLIINLKYGSEVSKELTPLWILGPLILAVYIKMFQGLCSLYVFSYIQTVNVIRNLPNYSILVFSYVAHGNLKKDIRAKLLDIRNWDYREISRKKMKDLETWLVEKYLDFLESIWPYYCRTIRFLKRANFI